MFSKEGEMANRVEGFDEAILHHARNEFLEKGFNDASLRIIAQNAGVSTSTIYTRYSDKEGLFQHLVEPAVYAMRDYIYQALNGFKSLTNKEQKEQQKEYSDSGFPGLIDIIYDNFDEFKLLVNCTPNTLYHDFLESVVEIDMECTRNFLKNTKSKAYAQGRITDGFLHVVSSAFYSGLFEVVIHDMPRDEAEIYINELRRFYNNGWKEYF